MSTCELCDSETGSRYLCTRHRDRLGEQLAALPALYAEVGEYLVPRQTGWGDIVPTRAAAGPRSPINEDVLDTVNWGRATEVLSSWRTDIRRVRWPHRNGAPAACLDADCAWLVRELDWIAGNYLAAGDFALEVWTLYTQARTVVGDPEPRVQRLGYCVATVDDQGTVCGAVLTRLPAEPLACRWCGASYTTATDLLLLEHYQPKKAA